MRYPLATHEVLMPHARPFCMPVDSLQLTVICGMAADERLESVHMGAAASKL
jgi:hypothetical protein